MKINYQNKEYALPDFLIVGAAKSGTTSIHYYLKAHHRIFMPEDKEPYFFSFWNENISFSSPDKLMGAINDLDAYSNSFIQSKEEQVIGDASPSYLYTYDKTIKNIRKIYGEKCKELRIIIIIREPVARAWSQYLHFKKFDKEPLDYGEAFNPVTIEKRLEKNWNIFYDYLGFSKYSESIKAYKENFPHVKVYLFDELKDDSDHLINDIFSFLQLPLLLDSTEFKKQHNVSGQPGNVFSRFIWKIVFRRNPLKSLASVIFPKKLKRRVIEFISPRILERMEVPKDIEEKLGPYFNSDIENLEVLIEKDLKEWKHL